MALNDDDDLETKYNVLKEKVKDLEDKIAQKVATNLTPGVKIPKFDGVGDFYKFLREFNMLATASNWHPPACVRLLPLFLEGEAKEIYQNIPANKKNNWRSLTDELSEMTKKLDGPMWAKKLLAKIKMGTESITEYANKIREMVEIASPDPHYSKEARENESIHYFMNGLPTALKRKIFFMEKQKTLIDAISQTKKILQVKEEIENDEKVDEIRQQIAELKSEVNAINVNGFKRNETTGREFVNTNWRESNGQNDTGGNFRNNNWRGNQNYYRGRNPRGFNHGNSNYMPLGQNRNFNGNFENRARNFRPPQHQRENFSNNRGFARNRGRPRQNYRINAIGEESGPSTSARRSPTPTLTFLTIAAIFCLLFGGGNAQYQICSDRVETTPIFLPNITDCAVPMQQKSTERKITLYLPVRVPKQFPVYKCHQKITKICTGSFLFL